MTIEEKLDVVYKLRLLYNSGEELQELIGMKTRGNNSLSRKGGKSDFLKRAVFHELVYKCSEEDGLDLEAVLEEYATVTELIEKYRSVMASKAWKKNAMAHCGRLMEMLVFNGESKADAPVELRRFCDSLDAENTLQLALAVLILLEALPRKMSTRQGDAHNMRTKYEQVAEFFEKLCERNVLYERIPRLYLLQQALEDNGKALTRIRLIRLTCDVIGNLSILATADQVALNGRWEEWNQLWPDLNGCWLGEKHSQKTPDFWEVEELRNGYRFIHYLRKNGEEGILHQQHFTFTFHQNTESYVCILHPKSIDCWLNGKKLDEEDVTYQYFTLDNLEHPKEIFFDPFIYEVAWFQTKKLKRTELGLAELTKGIYKIIDDFEEYAYQFELCLEAITPQYIYIKDSLLGVNHCVSVEKYGLENCTLGDAIGIITRGQKRYLAFDNQMVYIELEQP